jgi:IPT/TIG domain
VSPVDHNHVDLEPLARDLEQQLGVAGAFDVVTNLFQLSHRLWRSDPDQREPETFLSLVGREEADAVVTVLDALAARVDLGPPDRLAGEPRDERTGWRWQATTTLVTGGLALGAIPDGVADPDHMFDVLVHTAFGVDPLTNLARRVILLGAGDPWSPPFVFEFELPGLGAGCVVDIQNAGTRLAGAVSSGIQAEQSPASVDAAGITGLRPSTGSADDTVAILGSFQLGGRTVLFPQAGGGTRPANVTGPIHGGIEVIVPELVGDGPVGFLDTGLQQTATDVSAPLEFAEVVAACLGRGVAPAARRLVNVGLPRLSRPRPQVPRLAGDVNVFHGGPILVGVSPTNGTEPGPAVTVSGENLAPGDTVVLDGAPCATGFTNVSTLTFKVPDIAAGDRFLQIRRKYRRSNGTHFDVRATLKPTPPTGRLLPGTTAQLFGTGFGPTITATVDGAPTAIQVSDPHTLGIAVKRPAHAQLPSEKRGETVKVEVFDRDTSLGTVALTVATFRIATFGDSIAWGQGLLEKDKFTTKVATTISARRNGSIAVFALDRFAHSAAVLFPVSGESAATAHPPGTFTGECPSPTPSITAQATAWTSAPLSAETGEIDLVIVDGGINDADLTQIFNPFMRDDLLMVKTAGVCFIGMSGLLSTILGSFPAAKVVVLGYYPIISDKSDMAMLLPVFAALGFLGSVTMALVIGAAPTGLGVVEAALFYLWARQRLIDRSALFTSMANTSLAAAAAAAGPRVALAVPNIGPDNALFAPDPFVFNVGISTGGIDALDPVVGDRAAACGTGNPIANVASMGHPNVKGANAYANAIAAVLPSLGL